MTMVSHEIADAGKYDMIIPFGWWHHEQPLMNIETPARWCFEHAKCGEHVQDEGIADRLEWDETGAFDEEGRMIGRIGSTRQEEVQLEELPEPYWQYKDLFENEKAEMWGPRRIFNHVIDLIISKNNPWHLVRPLRLAHLAHITATANQDAST